MLPYGYTPAQRESVMEFLHQRDLNPNGYLATVWDIAEGTGFALKHVRWCMTYLRANNQVCGKSGTELTRLGVKLPEGNRKSGMLWYMTYERFLRERDRYDRHIAHGVLRGYVDEQLGTLNGARQDALRELAATYPETFQDILHRKLAVDGSEAIPEPMFRDRLYFEKILFYLHQLSKE